MDSHTAPYTTEQAVKLKDQMRTLQAAGASVRLDLAHLAEQLRAPRAKTFANEGAGRRLPVIERAAHNIYEIYPPDRNTFLSREECTDIGIHLHAFAINVYALFDNVTWVCLLEAGAELPPLKIGPFKKECRPFLPPGLLGYFDKPDVQRWFNEYGKTYRDSTAHRIAPYIPDRVFGTEEGHLWMSLHEQANQAMRDAISAIPGGSMPFLDLHEELNAKKERLGRNSPLIGLSLNGQDAESPVYLHPQLLCDLGFAHELIQTFTSAMREHYKWPAPVIPELHRDNLHW
jgi:hypothetical protein